MHHVYVIAVGGMTIAIYVGIYYLQRVQYRALYIADISAALWLLYVICDNSGDREPSRLRSVICLITTTAVLAMFPNAINILDYRSNAINGIVQSDEIHEYVENNSQNIYVEPTSIFSQPKEYTNPFAVPKVVYNPIGTGGWQTMTPYKIEQLESIGIKNPVTDLINNPNILFLGNYKIDELTEYYNKWHCEEGERIYFEKVDEVAGKSIYRVIKE